MSDDIRKTTPCDDIHTFGVMTYQAFRYAFGLDKNLLGKSRANFLVRHNRFELLTYRVGVCHSIQLG